MLQYEAVILTKFLAEYLKKSQSTTKLKRKTLAKLRKKPSKRSPEVSFFQRKAKNLKKNVTRDKFSL